MRIIDVRERTCSISSPIRNAVIDFGAMTCSLVAVVTDAVRDGDRVVGYGFTSNGRYGQGGLIRERFAPRLLGADPDSLLDESGDLDPALAWRAMMTDEKPGGHGERSAAVGALDMAVWDVVAKSHGVPLHRLLADRFRDGEVDADVFVYAAGGYYAQGGTRALTEELRGYLDLGYTVVKMKIGGAPLEQDLTRVEAALGVLGAGQRLAVDANGRLAPDEARRYGRALRDYDLFWFEEPVDPLDYAGLAEVAAEYPGSLATGENLFSTPDARNLLRHGGLRPDRDWLQFDCALSYGLVEYLRTLEALTDLGWSPRRCIPHGGHQMSLALAAGLGLGGNESYPGLFQPFGGFPDGVQVEDGHVRLPDLPGIGFEGKADLHRVMRELAS